MPRRRAGPAPDKAAAKRRSRAQPGLPGPRAGLAASAARTRAPGGPPARRRASGDRIKPAASPPKQRQAHRQSGQIRRVEPGFERRAAVSSAPKPGVPPVPRRRSPAGPQSGAAPCLLRSTRQCASPAPLRFPAACKAAPQQKSPSPKQL